jgi:hypothetical protein
MDLFTENRPETCAGLGLDCGTCVRRCASSTAAVCQDLQPYGAHKVFHQLYPSSACHPMAEAFVRAYQEAVAPEALKSAIPVLRAARASAAAAA